jgi:hypothetical protein
MSDWSIYISLLIPHPSEAKFLLVIDGNDWTLPRFQLDSTLSNLHLLQRALRERLDAEFTALYAAHRHEDRTEQIVIGLWMMENHSPDWIPPQDAKWADLNALTAIPLIDEILREPLQQTIATFHDPEPVERVPWMRRGWFATAQQWISKTLITHGYELKAPPEQFKQFTLSALLRTETTTGTVYFKVANQYPLFCHEPKTTQTLGTLFPEYIPTPLAIDEQRRWMLMTDFGNSVMHDNPDVETLKSFIQMFAKLQISTTSMLDTLIEAGCLDRRLNILAGQVDALMADDAFLHSIDTEKRLAFRAAAPTLKTLCAKLAAFNIPHTLVHGDFHGGNIAKNGDKILFFDWTDACIAHPFFDLPIFIDFDANEHEAALQEAYLTCWTAYEPLERLHEAYQIAQILAALHQAVSYQGIWTHSETAYRAIWDWAADHFVGLILDNLEKM